MKIAIAGAHGQISMLLHPILKKEGHEIRGLIRNPDHEHDLRKAGVEPVLADLEKEQDLSGAVGAADLVLFAAGAGPGSGAERKWTVDRDGAIKLIDAARTNRIGRYVMISAMGLDTPRGNEVFRQYLQAKSEADETLRNSGLDYTILKPGRLTNDPGTGKVTLGSGLDRGEIPREDVASAVAQIIAHPGTAGHEFDLISGNIPIPEAVQSATD